MGRARHGSSSIYRTGHTDLRKAVNGLSVLIQEAMGGEPFSGERKLLKAVWWDKRGFD
jgi:hypothetical protein